MQQLFQLSMAPANVSTNNIATSQSPGAGAILLNGSAVSGGVATLDMARRVAIASASNNSGITFTITGTARNGVPLVETLPGIASAGIGVSTQDFLTVSSVVQSATVTGAITIGTSNANGVASSPWMSIDRFIDPVNVAFAAVVTGTINFSYEYTLDDLNSPFLGTFPVPLTTGVPAAAKTATAGVDGVMTQPMSGFRVTINSYTNGATLKSIMNQAGIGPQ